MRHTNFDDVADYVYSAVERGFPFSLVRIGDAENSVLQYPKFCCDARVQMVLKRELEDRAYSRNEILAVRELIWRAAVNADVLGLYDSGHKESVCAVYREYISYAGIENGQSWCRPSIHFYLWESGRLQQAISKAEYVTLVTGRNVLDAFRARFPGLIVEQLLVPAERLYRLNTESRNLQLPHYPNVFRIVVEEIRAKSDRHLFLVGAGLVGKFYCDVAKRLGGIAIDIGSVFDYWANIPTREGYQTIEGGELRLSKPIIKAGLAIDSTPATPNQLQVYARTNTKLRISESFRRHLSVYNVERIAALLALAGNLLPNVSDDVLTGLPLGALILWSLECENQDILFLGGKKYGSLIEGVKKYFGLSGKVKEISGSDGWDNLAICLLLGKTIPQHHALIYSALQSRLTERRKTNAFFMDFRLFTPLRHELGLSSCESIMDLKVLTLDNNGAYAGVFAR